MKISVSNLFLPGWLLCAALLTAAPASAASSRCVENGDIVSLDGVASADIRAQGGRPAWVLHLSRPVCVNVGSRHAPVEEMFAIRIIGTPPPLGIPLQLTGKLLLAGTSRGPRCSLRSP